MENEFSVYQFFKNDICECVARFVSAEEAMKKAIFFTTNVAANYGITRRVIITEVEIDDFLEVVSTFLEDGEVAVFMMAGAEKARYITAFALDFEQAEVS